MFFTFVVAPLLIILSYLIGSIPTAYVVVRALCGIDIRTIGSGNVGTTNTSRVAGMKGTVIVFIIDILKGVIPAYIGLCVHSREFGLLLGVCAILGHQFPVWLQFRGGKGAATCFGMLLMLSPIPSLLAIGVWVLVTLLTRYVSLATFAAVIMAEISILLAAYSVFYKLGMTAILIFIVYKHRDNIKRLLSGTELKVGKKMPGIK